MRNPVRRKGHRKLALAAIFMATFASASAVLVAAIPDGSGSAASPKAASTATSTHTTATHAATEAAAADLGTVEKNTNSPDLPAYKPGVQHVEMDMFEKNVEIAPGKVVKVWTFGPKVPGPVIRVRVGDLVKVTINNKGSIPHSIDFHAARIAPSRAFRDVKPGESFSFEFTANDPGVFMYHCGTAPVVHHIANGMYGMIIVEPKGGLPKVDRELAFVQSDFYTSDTPGQPANNEKLMANEPDIVAFNGYAAQYKEDPIVVKRGERIRAYVLAAGPNTWSAFHVVGTVFDRAYIDGIHPENLSKGNQTLNLSASQGAVAEFTLSEEGTYPFVTHDFTNATKGAVGLLRTENAPKAAGGH